MAALPADPLSAAAGWTGADRGATAPDASAIAPAVPVSDGAAGRAAVVVPAAPPPIGGGPGTLATARRARASGGRAGGGEVGPHSLMVAFFDVLLCREDGEPRCLIGGDGPCYIESGGLAALGEDGLRALVAEQGGYLALCLAGRLTMIRAAEYVEEQGRWAVDVVRLDPSGLIDRRLDEYNGGQLCWAGRPDGTGAARRPEEIDRTISDDALESYNDGQVIFRGSPVPAAE